MTIEQYKNADPRLFGMLLVDEYCSTDWQEKKDKILSAMPDDETRSAFLMLVACHKLLTDSEYRDALKMAMGEELYKYFNMGVKK